MVSTKREVAFTPEQVVVARGRLTQREAAKALEVSERTMRNYETGASSITRAQMAALKLAALKLNEGE